MLLMTIPRFLCLHLLLLFEILPASPVLVDSGLHSPAASSVPSPVSHSPSLVVSAASPSPSRLPVLKRKVASSPVSPASGASSPILGPPPKVRKSDDLPQECVPVLPLKPSVLLPLEPSSVVNVAAC